MKAAIAELVSAVLLLIVGAIYCSDLPLFSSSVSCSPTAQRAACPYVDSHNPDTPQLGFSYPHLFFLCHGVEHVTRASNDPAIVATFAPVVLAVLLPFFLVEHREFLSATRTSYLSLVVCLLILHVIAITYLIDTSYWLWNTDLNGLCTSTRSYTLAGGFTLFFLAATASIYIGMACVTRQLNLRGIADELHPLYRNARFPYLDDVFLIPRKESWMPELLEWQTLVSLLGLLMLVVALAFDVGPTHVEVNFRPELAVWRRQVMTSESANPITLVNILEPNRLFSIDWQPDSIFSLESSGEALRLGLTTRVMFVLSLLFAKALGLIAPAFRLLNDLLCVNSAILMCAYATFLRDCVDILAGWGYDVQLEFRSYAVGLALVGMLLHTAGSLGSTRWSYLDSTDISAKIPDAFVLHNEPLPISVRRLFQGKLAS
jgi:hypothetical protein